jgi:alkanesulfonate monooxygenase SsuD/methylene tetrahydromethanopterin reductase-like flavin-dependent oxidoreductase (luciferase family)
MFTMRFGMRSAATEPSRRAELYGTAIDMCAWAETRGCLAAVVSEHHGADDGYLPSPVPLAAAIAARTTALPINVAALLLPMYEPVKLAEDLAVVDLISRGRVSYVIAIGYRDEEFAMFGVDRRRRAQIVEKRVEILRRLWAGEEVDVDGRPVRVTPMPFTPGGPMLAGGGGSEPAARRAARLGMPFFGERHDPDLEAAYADEAQRAGTAPPGCVLPPADVPLTVFVAEDPDKAWAELGEHLLLDATGYAAWNADRPGTASISFSTTVAALKDERGAYQIITPQEAAGYVDQGVPLALQPLVGGLAPDVAWRYLQAAAAVEGG